MKRLFIYIALFLLILTSCDKWLEIEPENKVSATKLYSTGNGFRTVINGLYENMATESLYGKEMSWGLLSAMSGNYNTTKLSDKSYKSAECFKYDEDLIKLKIQAVWDKMYNNIAIANDLIKNIENKPEDKFAFKTIEKNMIYGEALALRAFMHFDLLRLFAPSKKVNPDEKVFKYSKVHPNVYIEKISVSETLEEIIKDLKRSVDMVAAFDTLPDALDLINKASARFNVNSSFKFGDFFSSRGTRLNLYAVKALLARVYLYNEDYEEAHSLAMEIINKGYFDFTDENSLSGTSTYRKCPNEIIFGIYNHQLLKLFEPFNSTENCLALKNLDEIFAGDEGSESKFRDYRYQYLISQDDKGNYVSRKYEESGVSDYDRSYSTIIPIIRLSEMYHIAIEASYKLGNDDTFSLFNRLRKSRGCVRELVDTDENGFIRNLINDGRREYIGEGQMFFMYKRMNEKILDESSTIEREQILCLPVPDSDNALISKN